MPMKKKTPSLVPLRTEFHRDFKEFFPVAHGTLSLVRKPCNNPSCRLCATSPSQLQVEVSSVNPTSAARDR